MTVIKHKFSIMIYRSRQNNINNYDNLLSVYWICQLPVADALLLYYSFKIPLLYLFKNMGKYQQLSFNRRILTGIDNSWQLLNIFYIIDRKTSAKFQISLYNYSLLDRLVLSRINKKVNLEYILIIYLFNMIPIIPTMCP